MPTLRRILNPVDFSDASGAASKLAADMARAMGAELMLLHAINDPAFSYADGSGYLTPALVEQYEIEMRRRLEQVAAGLRTPGLTVTTRVARGTPQDAILATAGAERADMIVMGTHGRSGLGHLLLGSVAERVVRTASLPVLTVRSKG